MAIRGSHLVVVFGLVYDLDNESFMALSKAHTDYILAHEKAKDDWDYEGEWQHFFNMKQWVYQNFKPLTLKSDNFDIEPVKVDTTDLPF